MKTTILYTFSVLLIGLSGSLKAEPIQPFMNSEVFLFSEPKSVNNALKDKEGDYTSGGEHQYASLWLETGIKKGNWTASALYREEHRYKFTPDTADLYYSMSESHAVDAGREYQINLGVERFNAKGLRLAYVFDINPRFSLQIGGSYLRASNLLSGNLVGEATALSTSDYDYDVEIDYTYDEDKLFGRTNVDAPDGEGFTFDIQAEWAINERLNLSADIKDINGKIKWKNAPATIATLTSNTKTIGDDGFVIIQPALQGQHLTHRSYTQKIDPTAKVNLSYQLGGNNSAVLLKSHHFANKTVAGVGYQRTILNSLYSISAWPEPEVLELGYGNKHLSLSLGVDDIALKDARTFWLSMKLQ